MKIATNAEAPRPYGSMYGPTDGVISYHGRGEHAERKHRQIIQAIYECEDREDLAYILADHDAELDALWLDYPDYAQAVKDAAEECEAMLTTSVVSSGAPVTAQTPTTQNKGKPMFATNKTEGSQGPWMTWSSNGSAMKGIAPMTWVKRYKPEGSDSFVSEVIPGFTNPCVFDLDSLKLGWEKDGASGPERRYSSHYSVPMARPDESQDEKGRMAWSNALQVRIAVSQTEAVTWEQGSFAAYEAFTRLSKLIEAQFPGDNTLPVVQMTGVETIKLKSGSANVPIFEIVRWMPRPDILKDAAPAIATNAAPAATPAPAPQPTPQPTPAPTPQPAAANGGF